VRETLRRRELAPPLRGAAIDSSRLTKRAKRVFASTNDGVPMGEQKMIEGLLLTNLEERGFQATLDGGWIITNQRVRYKAEFAVFIDDGITNSQHTAGTWEQQSCLFRAQYANFKRTDTARQFVAEPERRNGQAPVRKLVQPRLMAPDRDAKVFDKLSAVAVVEPIGQINVLWGRPFPEPIGPFLRHQRIDKKGRVQAGDVVAVDFNVDVGVSNSPVKNSW
jgi:hypothetical protein